MFRGRSPSAPVLSFNYRLSINPRSLDLFTPSPPAHRGRHGEGSKVAAPVGAGISARDRGHWRSPREGHGTARAPSASGGGPVRRRRLILAGTRGHERGTIGRAMRPPIVYASPAGMDL